MSVYRAEVMVPLPGGSGPDDVLAEVLSALGGDALGGNARLVGGRIVSVVVRFEAAGDGEALAGIRRAAGAVTGVSGAEVSSLRTGRGGSARSVSTSQR